MTCPTSTVVIACCLATAIRAAVTSRIWLTPPGAPSTPSMVMVCTESTISSCGPHRLHVAEQRGQVGLGGQVEVRGHGADPVRPQPHLGRGFLAGDVQHRARRGGVRRRLQQQRGLAHARLAGQQHHRPGHQAAAQHPVQLVQPGRAGPGGAGVHLADGHRGGGGREGGGRPARRRPGRPGQPSPGRASERPVPPRPSSPAPRPARAALPKPAARVTAICSTVPQAWHSPQRPDHFVVRHPHSAHWNAGRRGLRHGPDATGRHRQGGRATLPDADTPAPPAVSSCARPAA